jgi:hypothetical protein
MKKKVKTLPPILAILIYLAWFKTGREFEDCEHWDRAIGAYEHGLAFKECACVYVGPPFPLSKRM